MKKFISFVAAAFISVGLLAQEENSSVSLNLQEAVDYAVQHNKSLKNARQEVEKSDKGVWEAISQGLPQVDATLDYMTYFNYEMEFSFGGDFDPTSAEFIAAEAQAQSDALAMFSGIPAYGINPTTPQDLYNYNAGSTYENMLSSALGGGTILMSDQLTAKLQLGQLVFNGQYIVGIQTAKLARVIANQALDNSEIDTKEAVVNAYYLSLISEASLDMVEKNLMNLKEMKAQTSKMYEIGMAELLDVDQFQVTVNQLENTIKSMERNLQLSYNMLRFTLGLPVDAEVTLTDNLESLFEEITVAKLLLQDFDKESNVTYQILNSQADISKKLLDMEKWNYGPTVAAFYNYNAKLRTTGFDMTPKHLAGFNISLPIFYSGKRSASVAQAKIDYEIAQRNAEILGDQLAIQDSQLKFNLESNLENYYTQLENVEVANRVLENYKRKFENGMASSLDVTQANSAYLDAESSYLSALFEVMNARISLEKLINNLSTL